MPVISNLVYTVTDTTIVATWTTDVAADSNLSAGGKAAIDNGVAANSTSHQAIVCGLSPNTLYSCVVTSSGTSSSPQSVTTGASATRTLFTSINSFGSGTSSTNHGDTNYTFVSNDNKTYITDCDGYGFVNNTPNAGANSQIGVLTNESTLVGTTVNLLTSYGAFNTFTGTDGPSGASCTNKITGLFGMLGNLYLFMTRQGSSGGAFYNNVIMSTDKGATWNNYQSPSSFSSTGSPINTATYPLPSNTYGFVSPIRYGADDGTLGYNTAGNGIDGANGYVYMSFVVSPFQSSGAGQHSPVYLMRQPRIQFASQTYSGIQYWVGPSSPAPADFVNDSNWSNSNSSLTAITNPTIPITWPVITFVAGVNSYIMVGDANGIPSGANTSLVYSAPTPAGPWTQIYSNPDGGLLLYGFMPMHRDCINNSATDNASLRLVYSGAENSFTTNYYPTVASVVFSSTLMANTFVQGVGSTSGQNSQTPFLAYSSNVTAGNLLIVSWRTGQACNSVTDTLLNSWTVVYDQVEGNGTHGGWAYAFSGSSGANTVTLHLTASTGGNVIVVAEYNGPNTFRAASTVAIGATSSLVTNAVTATAGDLLIAVLETNAGESSAPTISGGVTNNRVQGTVSGLYYINLGDNLSATGGSTTATWSFGSPSASTAGIGALFQASISGNAGVAGATITYSGSASGSVTADGSGNYTIPLGAGTYTITPSLAGYSFSPSSQNKTITNASISGVNFTAAMTNLISGNCGSAGASVTAIGFGTSTTQTVTADGSGNYTLTALSADTYYVSASQANKQFSPAYSTQTIVSSDITGVNFASSTSIPPSPGLWEKQGVVLTGTTNAQPGSVLYEGGSQLGLGAGNVFKTWFMDSTGIRYAESLDGKSWTVKSGTIVATGSWPTVFKNGGTYYLYYQTAYYPGTGTTVATSTDGINFVVQSTGQLPTGSVGAWDASSVYQLFVVEVSGGVWKALYTGQSSTSFILSLGYATSSDGITWTKGNGGNPVWFNGSAPFVTKIGSTYYAWLNYTNFWQSFGGQQPLDAPTDIYRIQSTDLINWTGLTSALPRTLSTEGADSSSGQTGNAAIVQVGSTSYMFYMGTTQGFTGSGNPFTYRLATAQLTIADIVQTNEGVSVGTSNSTPTFVQSVNHSNGATSAATCVSPSMTNTAGNTLVAFFNWAGNQSTVTISDTLGNTWVRAGNNIANGSNEGMTVWVATNCKGGSNTITGTVGVGAQYLFITVQEFSPSSGFGAVQQNTSSTTGIIPTVNNITVPSTKCTLVAYVGIAANNSQTAGSGFTMDFTSASSGNSSEYWLNPPAGNTAIAFGSNATAVWAMTALVLFPPAAFSVSGSTGVAGTSLSATGTASASATSFADGNYLFSGLGVGSYTITPSGAYTPSSSGVTVSSADVTGVNFSLGVYSQPDCRNFGHFPNASRVIQGTVTYDVQTSSNAAVPGTDSRTAGAPVASGTYPQNSRTPGTYGPGE